jgi:hypothetical protein
MKAISRMTLIGVIFLNLTISCVQDIEVDTNQDNLNTFKMTVNGQAWTPSVIDSCYRTFRCNMASLNEDNFYTIEAYRDPLSTASLMSENFFEIKIMKVNETGNYIIDGEFRDFSNYARLTINDVSGKRRYQNKENGTSFKVNVTQLFPRENSPVVGIGGSFDGILFNLDNPSDSIIIAGGEFIFRKTNHNSFNQCKE